MSLSYMPSDNKEAPATAEISKPDKAIAYTKKGCMIHLASRILFSKNHQKLFGGKILPTKNGQVAPGNRHLKNAKDVSVMEILLQENMKAFGRPICTKRPNNLVQVKELQLCGSEVQPHGPERKKPYLWKITDIPGNLK